RRRRGVVTARPAELTAEEQARLEALGVGRRSDES
ncbi:MAG: cytochrome C biogenesis protein, partial [Methylocystis sp.]